MEQLKSNRQQTRDNHDRVGLQDQKLLSPAMALFRADCKTVLSFLRLAHQRQTENAKRFGVPAADLRAYENATSQEGREAALKHIRSTLESENPGHTGSFPDYLGAAQRLKAFYKEASKGAINPAALEANDPRPPAAVARTYGQLLLANLSHSQHVGERGEAIVLLNRLIKITHPTMRSVSEQLEPRFKREVFGADQRERLRQG
jgi:hypothetical protein